MKRAFTVGRQEHSKDPGSGRREPLCHVAGFGVNVVAGRRLGSQALAQVPVLAGKWELMAGMKRHFKRAWRDAPVAKTGAPGGTAPSFRWRGHGLDPWPGSYLRF